MRRVAGLLAQIFKICLSKNGIIFDKKYFWPGDTV